MKDICRMVLGLLLAGCSSAYVFADVTTNKPQVDEKVTRSLADFKCCDVRLLANQLGSQYTVVYMPDDQANYSYYMIKNAEAVNVDGIRKAVCEFVVANKCYVYWGNVANVAMFSQQKAAWFPADTSPHYLLSPIITCNHVGKNEGNHAKTL